MFHISASNLINSIDPKADPCNDFYQFACGKWRKKHVIPEYASITGVTHKLNDELDIILKREITWYDLISIAKYTMSFIQIIIYYIFHACVKCRFLLSLDKKGTALFFPILTFLISFELLSNSLYFWYVASFILFFKIFKLTDVLERKIEDSDIEAVRNAKRYYQSCVDVGMKKKPRKPWPAIRVRLKAGWSTNRK